MVDSHGSRTPLPPAEIVHGRLDENRLFEARFLFDKFSVEIDPAVREQLRRQLETGIARAEKRFNRGGELEQAGELEKAAAVYKEVAAVAVDFPDLDQARQRVEIALELGLLQPQEPSVPEGAAPEPAPTDPPPETGAPSAGRNFLQHRKPLSLLLSLLAGPVLVAVFLFFRPEREPVSVRPAAQPELKADVQAKPPERASARSLPEVQPRFPESKPGAEQEKSTPLKTDGAGTAAPENVFSVPAQPKAKEKTVPVQQEAPVEEQKKSAADQTAETRVSAAAIESGEERERPVMGEAAAPLTKGVRPESTDPPRMDASVAAPAEPVPEPVVLEREQERDTEPSAVVAEPEVSVRPVEVPETEDAVSAGAGRTYTVRPGDTLEIIAARVYGDRYKWSSIVRANPDRFKRPPYILSVGMQLQVPPLALLEAEQEADLFNEDGTYTVQSGDTLGSIARKVYGSSRKWETLYELNRDRLPTPGALQVGQKLQVNTESPGTGDREPVGE